MDKSTRKEKLLKKLVNENIFWSYDTAATSDISDSIFIEHTLIYADVEEIKELFLIFNKEKIKRVWENELKNEALLRKIKNTFPKGFKIETLDKKQLNLKIEGVKITFFANNWEDLKKNEKLAENINIAPIKLLTGMKINSLFLRAKFRDYYDLYVINKEKYTVEQMYEIIKEYMPEINKKLFQTALVFTDDIKEDNIGHLKPKYDVNLYKIRKSFEEQISESIHSHS